MRYCKVSLLIVVFLLSVGGNVFPEEENRKDHKRIDKKSTVSDKVTFSQFDINNIASRVSTNGQIASWLGGRPGLEWPKGSEKGVVFAAGPWMIGKVGDEIRSAAAEFHTEFVSGPLGGDPFNPRNKIFRVSPEFPDGLDINGDGDFDDTFSDLRDEGISSHTGEFDPWSAWPVENGAPVDENGDPEIIGDGTVWMVLNDGDSTAHDNLWGTAPLGVEVQTTLFGFSDTAPLEDVMFVKWLIINKGNNRIDSTYFGLWADSDVGFARDDLIGVDVAADMGYFYNNDPIDDIYGAAVPAVGFDFLQGPIIPSPRDTAFAFGKTVYGFKNLPLFAFSKFIIGGVFEEPYNAPENYNFLKGLTKTGFPLINPLTGEVTTFAHDGDPVTGRGWLDINGGDRRAVMSAGPFNMAPGDSQEVVAAVMVARGTDRLNSITELRFVDTVVQTLFDNRFELPQAVTPQLRIAELDREVVLLWDENREAVERFARGGYRFEGYNIYQGETENGPWHRLTTFDRDNEIGAVIDKEIDDDTELVVERVAAHGSNTGLQHFFSVKTDTLNSAAPLINYRKYYFAVTSYLVNLDGIPRVIESPIVGWTAIPSEADLGDVLTSEFGDMLQAEHTSGTAAADVIALVVDPEKITGEAYKVTFPDSGKYRLLDTSTDRVVTEEIIDIGGLSNSLVEGLMIALSESSTFVTPKTYLTEEFVFDADPSDPGLDLWFDGTAFGPRGDMASVSDDLPRAAAEFLQLDIELRFTGVPSDQSSLAASIDSPIFEGGQWGTYYEQSVATGPTWLPADLSGRQWNPVRLPFELWDIENGRQVNCIVLNRNSDGGAPYGATAGDPNTPGLEPRYRISGRDYIIPMMTDYDAQFAQNNRLGWDGIDPGTGRPNSDFTTWFLFFHQNGDDTWTTGDVFQLTYDNPILPGVDEFEFDTPANVRDDRELALSQIDKINVFPNPYMGFNLEAPDLSRRFVRFTHLEGEATIRIFTISGRIVRVLEHDGSSQFCEWDLANEQGRLVASGVYLVQVDLHTLGAEKLLKLAVFQPRQ